MSLNKMSKDEIMETINKGANGMPAGIIKGEEAEKVAEWLSAKKWSDTGGEIPSFFRNELYFI